MMQETQLAQGWAWWAGSWSSAPVRILCGEGEHTSSTIITVSHVLMDALEGHKQGSAIA